VSFERRLVVWVGVVLLVSLIAGVGLTYQHAASRVHTEMIAALAVGRRIVQNAVDDSAEQPDSTRRLARIVAAFSGDRHLRATVTGPRATTLMQSTVQPPAEPAPRLFLNLIAGPSLGSQVALPTALQTVGALALTADPHNEAAEAWDDVKLNLSVLSVFFCLVLALVVTTLRRAVRPLQDLRSGLTRIAAGDYAIRLAPSRTKELAQVQAGFNIMAERLADMEMQNRLLQTRVQRVQEEERAELARDLHDEVAPFLFAVSADASLIRQYVANAKSAEIDARAETILASVGHMQRHLRQILCRLMPDVLLDLGLAGAIETLVHSWSSRRPDIAFTVQVDANPLDDRRTSVAFRVVQESLSNAVRHANPTKIAIRVTSAADGCVVEITDNGIGLPGRQLPTGRGLGLLSMRERVIAIGGRLTLATSPGSTGVNVRAELTPVALS
jgi:two-component system sensor histidine kinase UhpB